MSLIMPFSPHFYLFCFLFHFFLTKIVRSKKTVQKKSVKDLFDSFFFSCDEMSKSFCQKKAYLDKSYEKSWTFSKNKSIHWKELKRSTNLLKVYMSYFFVLLVITWMSKRKTKNLHWKQCFYKMVAAFFSLSF